MNNSIKRGTAVVHTLTASNDVTEDTGWVDIFVSVALDHDSYQTIDADISEELLVKRLQRDGWTVILEDDAFTCQAGHWIPKLKN